MDFIFGMDNSVLFAILIIIGGSLFILWTILNYLNQKLILNQTNNQNQNQGITDPYFSVAEEEECPICTERIKYKIELDCRHNFCGRCIGQLIQHSSNFLKCPLCRSHIRLINYDNISNNNETKDFYDQIVKYNYVNLNGYNFVKYFLKEFLDSFIYFRFSLSFVTWNSINIPEPYKFYNLPCIGCFCYILFF